MTLVRTAVDVNADLGESFGRWSLGDDERLVEHLTSANLACGFHAADYRVMDRTVALCRERGVAVGAQPGYPDLQGFGRRPMSLPADEITQLVLYQVGALDAFCRRHGVDLQHVKPHGALYNRAAVDPVVAMGIARAVASFSRELLLVGLATSEPMRRAAADCGLAFVPEAFADRRYEPDGTLRSRALADAVIDDVEQAAAQAVEIATTGHVSTSYGSHLETDALSICVHGDTPNAVEIAAAIRGRLDEAGVAVVAMRQLAAERGSA